MHNFTEKRSTTFALNCVIFYLQAGLDNANLCQTTLIFTLDMIAAFDIVDLYHLLSNIGKSNLSKIQKSGYSLTLGEGTLV